MIGIVIMFTLFFSFFIIASISQHESTLKLSKLTNILEINKNNSYNIDKIIKEIIENNIVELILSKSDSYLDCVVKTNNKRLYDAYIIFYYKDQKPYFSFKILSNQKVLKDVVILAEKIKNILFEIDKEINTYVKISYYREQYYVGYDIDDMYERFYRSYGNNNYIRDNIKTIMEHILYYNYNKLVILKNK